MGDLHFRTAEQVASRLMGDTSTAAVLLHGSVAHRMHRSTSNIDLAVIGSATTGLKRMDVDGLRVEMITRTSEDWKATFDRPVPSWTYAFSDGVVLDQVGHAAECMVAAAVEVLQDFRPQQSLLAEHLAFWEHVRPKLVDSIALGDAAEIGYSMSLSTPRLAETFFILRRGRTA